MLSTGESQGNRSFWYEAANEISEEIIRNAAQVAEENTNSQLAIQAMGWAINRLRNDKLAAMIGSQKWIQETNPEARESSRAHEHAWPCSPQ